MASGWRFRKAGPGTAPAWQAIFVSASQAKARSYTYSVVESEGNLHKGVFAGLDQSWRDRRESPSPFPWRPSRSIPTKPIKPRLKKGAEYDKKNPGKPINFLLESNTKFPDMTWRVIWGESVGPSNFSVFVDASTGQYLEIMR